MRRAEEGRLLHQPPGPARLEPGAVREPLRGGIGGTGWWSLAKYIPALALPVVPRHVVRAPQCVTRLRECASGLDRRPPRPWHDQMNMSPLAPKNLALIRARRRLVQLGMALGHFDGDRADRPVRRMAESSGCPADRTAGRPPAARLPGGTEATRFFRRRRRHEPGIHVLALFAALDAVQRIADDRRASSNSSRIGTSRRLRLPSRIASHSRHISSKFTGRSKASSGASASRSAGVRSRRAIINDAAGHLVRAGAEMAQPLDQRIDRIDDVRPPSCRRIR